MARSRFLPDNFTLALVATVVLASLLPASGGVGAFLRSAHHRRDRPAVLPARRQAVARGDRWPASRHWRLHLLVLACTFVLFPLLGLALRPLLSPLVTPELYTGVLFLCVLPATVQSAIAFTSMARGNIPAAVCSASASTLLGVFVTPLLVGLLVVPTAPASAARSTRSAASCCS